MANNMIRKENGPRPVDLHIGRQIRAVREYCGLSQSALGERIGVTFQQVQKYERGANRVSGSMLYEIAGALGITVSTFYEGLPQRGATESAPAKSMPGARSFGLLRAIDSPSADFRKPVKNTSFALGQLDANMPEHDREADAERNLTFYTYAYGDNPESTAHVYYETLEEVRSDLIALRNVLLAEEGRDAPLRVMIIIRLRTKPITPAVLVALFNNINGDLGGFIVSREIIETVHTPQYVKVP